MAFGNLEAAMKKWREEQERLSPGSTPEAPLPPEVQQEFASRFPEVDPANYEVNVSDTTATMNGRPESLPRFAPNQKMDEESKLDYSVEKDLPAPPLPSTTPLSDISPDLPTETAQKSDIETIFPSTDNDMAAREASLAALERKRKLGIIPQLAAGFGDAVAMGVSAKGGNVPSGSLQRMVERQEKELETGKKDIETKLRNDPNSDISKQYQALVAQFLQKDPSDPTVLGLTANQIAEKIPQIEKLATLRQTEELKRAELAAREKESKEVGQTTGQKAVDKQFAKTYEDFIVSGGYGKAVGQLKSLVDIADRLDSKKENLTGPLKGRMPEMFRPTSVAARQDAERVIQEGLRATLGAQFTEREGERFLARSYDEKLPESINADKLRQAAQTLQLMIRAKKQAADYYEDKGTLSGYKGKLYTLKDGVMTEASPEEFESILSDSISSSSKAQNKQQAPRKTKSNLSYTVED